jgi:hypothetical protein
MRIHVVLGVLAVSGVLACGYGYDDEEAGCSSSSSAMGPTTHAPRGGPPMTVTGRAGYVAGVIGPEGFRSVWVGAWSRGPRGTFCGQVLSAADGSYELLVSAYCFVEGENVYLTAGGLDTCVHRPFHSGGRVEADLYGRWGTCP